jgi:L-threonylcarbamoyladenylate synthase
MPKIKNSKLTGIIKILKTGGIGVVPTDTLYGLVGQAKNPETIKRIAKLKKRGKGKPFIILISSLKDLAKFGVKPDKKTLDFLREIWPGPVSVALTKKLSFRLPKNKLLIGLIKKTGPLVAPSANPEGLPPATTMAEAKRYFGDPVKSAKADHGASFYLSAGKKLSGQPSTLIKIKNGKIEILRQGRVKIKLWKQ